MRQHGKQRSVLARRCGVHDGDRLSQPAPDIGFIRARTTLEFLQCEHCDLGSQRTVLIRCFNVIDVRRQPTAETGAPAFLTRAAIVDHQPEIDNASTQSDTAAARTVEQHRTHGSAKAAKQCA